ncbi:hypothetical protein OH805_36780 [Streptomyces sp. NBC_00879]|uniref:hypothetical protein n=1 Tax=Streptomyces sp. NBC_00879 TaxID=2975855 RepID=UPI00386CB32B|nr:hypothetical protein OH805_36780 [Streptomyces sp. NBC_00879]
MSADPALRETSASLNNPALIRRCAHLAPDRGGDYADVRAATPVTPRLLAQRMEQLTEQVRDLQRRLTAVVQTYARQLLESTGTGPDSAITLLITAGDNPERLA